MFHCSIKETSAYLGSVICALLSTQRLLCAWQVCYHPPPPDIAFHSVTYIAQVKALSSNNGGL